MDMPDNAILAMYLSLDIFCIGIYQVEESEKKNNIQVSLLTKHTSLPLRMALKRPILKLCSYQFLFELTIMAKI